jgi:hypothetical protein
VVILAVCDDVAHLLLVHAQTWFCVQGVAGKVSKTSRTSQEALVEISAVGTTSASFPAIIGADGPELTQVSRRQVGDGTGSCTALLAAIASAAAAVLRG